MKNPIDKIKEQIQELKLSKTSDIIIYNGTLGRPYDNDFILGCRNNVQSSKVLLVLVTSGGDGDAAYRIGRGLQNYYDEVSIFVPGWCKSAGTLLCIAAHALYLGDLGELGPIDAQRAIKDELGGRSSGLTEDAAIESLENAALKTFNKFVIELTKISKGQVTFRTAADTAEKMIGNLLGPIASQIDPTKIGENSRAVSIAHDYGIRLDQGSRNLKNEYSIRILVSTYSSHGFVIDRNEAKQLFKIVEDPTEDMEAIFSILGEMALFPLEEDEPPTIIYINQGETNEPEGDTKSDGDGKSAVVGANDGRHPENADSTQALRADTV